MNKYFYVAIILLLAIIAFKGSDVPIPFVGNYATATTIGSATTSTSVAITTSARVLSTTTNVTDPDNSYLRVYTSICNPNANPVYLNLDNDKASNFPTGNVTTVIASANGYSTCYEITDRNQYHGSITASSTGETSTRITIKDYVK